MTLRLACRNIFVGGAEQNRLVLLLAYILMPFEYYLRGVTRYDIIYVTPAVLLNSAWNIGSMVNRNTSVIRISVSAISKLNVVTARMLVSDRGYTEVQLVLQPVE